MGAGLDTKREMQVQILRCSKSPDNGFLVPDPFERTSFSMVCRFLRQKNPIGYAIFLYGNGAACVTRTRDLRITNAPLYQLS